MDSKQAKNFSTKTLSLEKPSLFSSKKQIPLFSPKKSPHSTFSDKKMLNHMQTKSFHNTLSGPFFQSQAFNRKTSSIKFPISSKRMLSEYKYLLAPEEQAEIIDYDEIYYLNSIFHTTFKNDSTRLVFDDEEGNYLLHDSDHLAYRYEILNKLGHGTFGQVIKCYDHKRKETVAIKMIKNKKRFHKQAICELKILQKLRHFDPENNYNVVKIKNYFIFRKHICISFELLSLSLYDLLAENHFHGLSLTLIHRFSVQLLVCLQYIQTQQVIHCDLKPENILLKNTEKSLINVIDFGSSCAENDAECFYIQSRFYRAPEVVLGIRYGFPIDVWSLGCILAELYTGRPLFPGNSEEELLGCMIDVLGSPPEKIIELAVNKKKFFAMENSGFCTDKKGSLDQILKGSMESFVDFVKKCLA